VSEHYVRIGPMSEQRAADLSDFIRRSLTVPGDVAVIVLYRSEAETRAEHEGAMLHCDREDAAEGRAHGR
jgi:hypothetical protein